MISTAAQIHYATNPVKIGKHQWRLVVFSNSVHGRCTAHQFRQSETDAWRDYHEWPSYNFNDGCFAGLPRSLANKWLNLMGEIKAALRGGEQSGMQLF